MKLDPSVMRTMAPADFRVLAAVEAGMQHHYLVPAALIASNAGLRHGGSHKILSSLLRDKLLSHEVKGIDGYRLTNAGYDILALHNLKSRGLVAALGQRIGTGKESDIYLAATPTGQQIVLKFHRLGRTSFRNVRKKRDYFNAQHAKSSAAATAHSWLFLSRLSALKEFSFLTALHRVKYPTPAPLGHNRHILAMSLVRGVPLYQVLPKQLSLEVARDIYRQTIGVATRLAKVHGLVHCDLNEFNVLVDVSGIQALATNDAHDPYVRHSGRTVAGPDDATVGMLSKPAWEQSLHEEHGKDQLGEPVEPTERLADGQPKPIVTLIDFPQMISTKHPNAQDYYDRDVACVKRFFELKLQCRIPEDETAPSWADIVHHTNSNHNENDRLDDSLQASGFSEFESHGLELYYFERSGIQHPGGEAVALDTAVKEEEEGVDDDHDNGDEDDNNVQEGHDDDDDLDGGTTTSKFESLDEDCSVAAAGDGDDDKDDHCKIESLSVLDAAQLQGMTREKLEALAKERVRRQLDEQRKKSRNKGAFRKPNSNKTYVKGKRVMQDSF